MVWVGFGIRLYPCVCDNYGLTDTWLVAACGRHGHARLNFIPHTTFSPSFSLLLSQIEIERDITQRDRNLYQKNDNSGVWGVQEWMKYKMVSRNSAVALGITFVILVAVLGGIFAYYLVQRDSTISSLNSQITSLNNQTLEKNYTIIEQNQTISSLEAELTNMQEQAKHFYVDNSSSQSFFVYNATGPTASTIWNVSSGYIVVWVSDNNNISTYVQVYGASYNEIIDPGPNGIALFQVPAAAFYGVVVGAEEYTSIITWSAMYVG